MTKKFVAGFDLDKVYEEEEARLKSEREAAEAARRRQELGQKRAGRKPPSPPPAPATPPAVVVPPTLIIPYHGIEFEHTAYREAGETDKAVLTYDASLARLRAAGFERHARPQEAFGFLAAGLEWKLTPQERKIRDDMLTSYGEWLSLAFERQGDTLITYLDPEGLEWGGEKGYIKKRSFKYTDTKDFDIAGKMSQHHIDLNQFPDDLIQFLYGHSFADLPQEMRVGQRKAQVYLPPDKTAWPVVGSYFGSRYIVGGFNYIDRASRGVVPSAPKK